MEMENLRKVIKTCLFVVVFACTFNLFSQDQFYINKFEGIPYIEINDSIKPITRGMAIKKNAVLTLNENDTVHFINKDGNEYIIEDKGDYAYSKLIKIPALKIDKPYIKTFLTFTWKQFTNNVTDNRSRSGVVYRGDEELLMQYPIDSARIISSQIQFKWSKIKDKEKDYYLILKDIKNNKTTIIGTLATSITLMVDDSFLKTGHQYKWAITESKYENPKKSDFYTFSLVTESEFKNLHKEANLIAAYLKKQGLSKREIQTVLCEAYKICK